MAFPGIGHTDTPFHSALPTELPEGLLILPPATDEDSRIFGHYLVLSDLISFANCIVGKWSHFILN